MNATALCTAKGPLAAFVAGTACLTSQAAQAASGREWQPRRHHRRIVDKQSVVDLAKPMKVPAVPYRLLSNTPCGPLTGQANLIVTCRP